MNAKHPITSFGLIRHAITLWNQAKRIQGQLNTPLAPEGIRQAEAWARFLADVPWHRILASDTGRAVETVDIVNDRLKVSVTNDARLREQDWGQWTGMTVAQIRSEAPLELARQEAAGWKFCPPGGENREDVFRRCRNALSEAAEKWPGERILVITHEGVIKCLLYRLLEENRSLQGPFRVQSYWLHRLLHDGKGLYVQKANALNLMDP